MKKKYFLILPLLVVHFFNAQSVGVNTTSPASTLHVNGSIQVDGEIYTGGNDKTLGHAGNIGDFLVSQGDNVAPIWTAPSKLNIPEVVGIAKRTIKNVRYEEKDHRTIPFDVKSFEKPQYIAYNSAKNTFRIIKGGYYLVNANIEILEIHGGSGKNPSDYGGTVIFRVRQVDPKSPVDSIREVTTSSGSPVGSGFSTKKENLSNVIYLDANSDVIIDVLYTRDFYMNEGSVSFIYISEK